jgi:hypothetical protein
MCYKLENEAEKQLELCQRIINITRGKKGMGKAEIIVVVVLAGAVLVILLLIVNESLIYIQAELNSNRTIIKFAQTQAKEQTRK